jgi:hypothetical protein
LRSPAHQQTKTCPPALCSVPLYALTAPHPPPSFHLPSSPSPFLLLKMQPLLRPSILQLKTAVEHVLAGGAAATLPSLSPATAPPAPPNPLPADVDTPPPLPPRRPHHTPSSPISTSPPLSRHSDASLPSPSSWSPVISDATPAEPHRQACQPAAAALPPVEWAHFDTDDTPQSQPLHVEEQQPPHAGASAVSSAVVSSVVAAGVAIPTGTDRDGCAAAQWRAAAPSRDTFSGGSQAPGRARCREKGRRA